MKSSSMRFFLGPRKNGKGSIGFGSPALLRVRAEPEAREGFLGEKPSDTMFEAFYKTAMSVRAPSRAPGSEALPRRTRAAPTTKYTRTPSIESDRDRPVPRLHSSAQRSSVYVAVVIAGALVGEKVRHPPAGSRSDLPSPWTRRGRLPRYSLAGAIHHRKKKSPLADSAPRGARFADPPSSECAGREQRFRRHVGVAQQGQAVQGHDHPRAE
jgi:hypothetical protein